MRYGTEHFKTVTHAVDYYDVQGIDRDEVLKKLRRGSIKVGAPEARNGERTSIDSDGRYWLETRAAA